MSCRRAPEDAAVSVRPRRALSMSRTIPTTAMASQRNRTAGGAGS